MKALLALILVLSLDCEAQVGLTFRDPTFKTTTAAASTPAWSPSNDIAGAAYWFDAYDNAQGSTVNIWTDRIQGFQMFKWNVAPTNGPRGMFFNGSTTALTNVTGMSLAPPYSILFVFQQVGAGDQNNSACLLMDSSRNEGFMTHGLSSKVNYCAGGGNTDLSVALSDGSSLTNSPSLWNWIWANGASYTNGTATASVSPKGSAAVLTHIGNNPGGGAFQGNLQHIIIWTNHTITVSEKTALNDWCNTNDAVNYTTSMAALWKLDENTGTAIADSSGNGWSGTLGSYSGGALPLWTNAQINSGLAFAGKPFGSGVSTNFVTISSSTALGGTNSSALTIGFWYRLHTITNAGDPHAIISKVAADALATDNRYPGWEVHFDDNTPSTYFVQSNAASASALQTQYASGIQADTNSWHLYVSVKGTAGNTLDQFWDGRQINIGEYLSSATVTNWTSTNNIVLGGGTDLSLQGLGSTPVTFPGSLDDVRIYTAALTPLQIWQFFKWGYYVKQ